jgi:hypothetical protein
MGLSLFGWGKSGVGVWEIYGGNVETLWRLKKIAAFGSSYAERVPM